MKEIWKDIPEYEGLYQVSNLGRVKSLPKLKFYKNRTKPEKVKEFILKQYLHNNYFTLGLTKDNARKTKMVHQLVAIAFLKHKPNGFNGKIVDHINNNPLDNRVVNLQLITNRENSSKDKKGGSSKYVGVSYRKSRKRWRALIKINGVQKELGSFKTEYEAHLAYQKKLKEINSN